MRKLIATETNIAALIARITLGICMFPHGLEKLQNSAATIAQFQGGMNIPPVFGWAAILAESVGSVLLMLGLLTRAAAASLVITMLVAILLVHGKNGLSLAQKGFEYNLALTGLGLIPLIVGGGTLSLDKMIAVKQA